MSMSPRGPALAVWSLLGLLGFSSLDALVPSLDNVSHAPTALSGSSCGRTPEHASDSDPSECRSCHGAIYTEWSDSLHAKAFRDEVYQEAIEDLEDPERCVGCHAPEPVLPRLGRLPTPRREGRSHGVSCQSCHLDRGDVIAGPFGAEHDDHESRRHPAFREERSDLLCNSCHDLSIGPVHALGRDFRESGLSRGGTSCVTCHMPEVRRVVGDGGPERDGRRHTLLGPSNAEFAATAFDITLDRDPEGNVELRVENRAGHRVPGLDGRTFRFELRHASGVETVEISSENPIYVSEDRRFSFVVREEAEFELIVSHQHLGQTAEILRRTERL